MAASLAGARIPQLFKIDHRRTQMILSLVAGVMLGVGILHLLPLSIQLLGDEIVWSCASVLAGLLFMFFLIRIFDFHQHDAPCETDHCDDEHHHRSHRDISWSGLFFGLAIHTIIDGIALAVAYKSAQLSQSTLPAFGIFLAILLHKPLDSMSITTLMTAKNISLARQRITSWVFALLCPLGAALAMLGVSQLNESQTLVLGISLGFSAGVFICISLSDILPEVQFHSHDRFALSGMLIMGIAISVAINFVSGV